MHENTPDPNWTHPSEHMDEDDLHQLEHRFTDENYMSAYREASYHFLRLLYPALAHVMNTASVEIGLAQIRFALGIAEISMTDQAATIGVTPQCISKGAREFIRENNLPIPPCMESEASSESHRRGRINSIKSKQL
tara:strand:- start:8 stop:415 length:408 start_codon:yes stop_codon:yes gene_type:complete